MKKMNKLALLALALTVGVGVQAKGSYGKRAAGFKLGI